jgi:hypothetical protein
MLFRARFGALGWCQVSLATFALFLWLSGLHSRSISILAFFLALIALQRVFNYAFIYWELDSKSFRERRFWNTKEIQWGEVTHVGSFIPSQPSSDYLEVDFARPALMSESGRIIAHPEDRQQFLASLHRFAPQAHFDV